MKPTINRTGMSDREPQQVVVALPDRHEARFEAALEPHQRIARRCASGRAGGMRGMFGQQILGHGRHQRAGQHERSDQREDHRLRQRDEQEARHPA